MKKNPEAVSQAETNSMTQGKGADAKVDTRRFGRSNPTTKGGINRPTKGR
jgi:hypothetical protein